MTLGLLCALAANEARAEKAWGVDSKALLVSFDTERPQFPTSLQLLRGLRPGEQVLAMDFRPMKGAALCTRIFVADLYD